MNIRPNLVTFSVPCDDLERAADFYRKLLGKDPEEPAPGNLEFELSDGVWLQLNGDPEESGKPARLLLGVDDIQSAASHTSEAGAEVGQIETYEDVLAWAEATGPGNQRVSLVQINS